MTTFFGGKDLIPEATFDKLETRAEAASETVVSAFVNGFSDGLNTVDSLLDKFSINYESRLSALATKNEVIKTSIESVAKPLKRS